jgi:UDP-3-O-[3-hydroxymyristoyl] N-acetylglucosamine deacetylase/3-hydroxyacyl-[acyl-carrier-protein] dehydratase
MSAQKQQTLASSATLTGTSLHTGEKVTLTMKPAPAGHGIKFRRVDLDDQPFIDAHVGNVQTVERATTLAQGSVKVHTVEHVISALAGMGVDNAIIEMDANEPPIGDGSALPYVQCIKKAGIAPQEEARRVFEIREPIHMETRGGSLITVVPDKTFRISCTQVGPDGRMTQYFSAEITPEIYETQIAPARTFVFYEDVQPLMEKGLIKGGSLENAVVIRGDSVMSKEPMRFPEEFARHKILDLVGDLMLSGKRIMGHVIAVKPGHGPNTDMARELVKRYQQTRAMVPPVRIPTGEAVMDNIEGAESPAPPLPFPHGRSRRRIRRRDEVYWCETGHHQRALLPGPLPRPPRDARRAPGRGHGAGRQHRPAPPAAEPGQNRLFHERQRGEIPQARAAR